MAFSESKFQETFPVERSPRDKGFVTDVRIYWNDRGIVLSLKRRPAHRGARRFSQHGRGDGHLHAAHRARV